RREKYHEHRVGLADDQIRPKSDNSPTTRQPSPSATRQSAWVRRLVAPPGATAKSRGVATAQIVYVANARRGNRTGRVLPRHRNRQRSYRLHSGSMAFRVALTLLCAVLRSA